MTSLATSPSGHSAASLAAPPRPGRAAMISRIYRSELLKLRTVRASGFILLYVAAIMLLVGGGNAAGTMVTMMQKPGSVDPAGMDPTGGALSGLSSALIGVAALGIVAVTSDYASGMVRTTFWAAPQRSYVLVGRSLALLTMVVPVALGAALLTTLTAKILLAQVGLTVSLRQPGVLRAIVGAALYLGLVSVFAAALGWLIRSSIGALVTWIAIWLVPGLLILLLPPAIAGPVDHYLPGNVGTAVAEVPGPGSLTGWTDLAVFAAYAVVLTGFALVSLRRRDA